MSIGETTPITRTRNPCVPRFCAWWRAA